MNKIIKLFGYTIEISKLDNRSLQNLDLNSIKLNFGPGPNWEKPSKDWYSVDVDPSLGDIVVDFQKFQKLPLKDETVDCVYGSHVFEHMSIFKAPIVFNEIFRVLKKGSIFRLILPDAEKSIKEYYNQNSEFLLFKRRKERAEKLYNINYTIFECLKEDFLSQSGQSNLLGKNSLAHQNAWDYETIKKDLNVAGFDLAKIGKFGFQKSQSEFFQFEGTYSSEANEDYRSLYVEAIK